MVLVLLLRSEVRGPACGPLYFHNHKTSPPSWWPSVVKCLSADSFKNIFSRLDIKTVAAMKDIAFLSSAVHVMTIMIR